MKDSYSFDLTDEGLEQSYQRHRVAYQRTFDRLGLPYVIVSAMSGAMGGSASEEFLAPMEVGEDTYVRCTNCDYAANTEAVQVAVPQAIPFDSAPPAHGSRHARHPHHPGRWSICSTTVPTSVGPIETGPRPTR
jgi:prolyl-tRNA synthetase